MTILVITTPLACESERKQQVITGGTEDVFVFDVYTVSQKNIVRDIEGLGNLVVFDKATVKTVVKGRRVDTGMKKLGAVLGGYSQTGVNVSLMPGVKVGAFSWVEAGLTLYEDVEDCVFVRSKGGVLVKERLEGRVRCCVERAPWEPPPS